MRGAVEIAVQHEATLSAVLSIKTTPSTIIVCTARPFPCSNHYFASYWPCFLCKKG